LKNFESCGTSLRVDLSYPSCWLSKVLKKIFLSGLVKVRKSAVPLQPASIGGGKI